MGEHAKLAEALGAWALGACSDEESAAVAQHLDDCVECAVEAARLRTAAGWLGVGEPIAPPDWLRGRVLDAARLRRTPGAAHVVELTRAYAVQVAALDALLGELAEPDLEVAVPRHGSVRGVITHLAGNDAMVLTDLDLVPAGGWREQATALLDALSAAPPEVLDRPARLAGPAPVVRPMRDALVQRTFETWIHADDVRLALDRPPEEPPPEQLKLIVGLGVKLLPHALRALGRERPGRTALLALTGCGGGRWPVALAPGTGSAGPSDVTITANTRQFCQLLANRRQPESFPHAVDGDPGLAADVLLAASTLGCD